MIIWLVAGAVTAWAFLQRNKPALTTVSPQPIPVTPLPSVSISPVVGGVQPQLEGGRAAYLTRQVSYGPPSFIPPDINQVPTGNPVDRSLIATSTPQIMVQDGVQPATVPPNDNQVSGHLIEFAGGIAGSLL